MDDRNWRRDRNERSDQNQRRDRNGNQPNGRNNSNWQHRRGFPNRPNNSRSNEQQIREPPFASHIGPGSAQIGLNRFQQIFEDASGCSDNAIGHRDNISGYRDNTTGHSDNVPNTATNKKFRGPRRVGFKMLVELANEDSDTLIIKLLSAASGFREVIYDPNLSNDYIVLIMSVLSRMSDSAFVNNKAKILEIASVEAFLEQLKKFIVFLPLQNPKEQQMSKFFWTKPNDFFQHFHKYCDMLLSLSPTNAVDILPPLVQAVDITIPHLKIVNGDIKRMQEKIQEKLRILQDELEAKRRKAHVVNESDEEPPDDFRDMSVYPLPTEITNRHKAFLRKNVVVGSYRDVNHYLDVQFRLLREDFVKPLREGICDFIENDKKKLQNIKIYRNVKFLSPYMVNSKFGVLLQLEIKDNQSLKRIMQNPRRFIYGSLMCFTADDFKTVIFGKIIERNDQLLHKGQLVIEFELGLYEVAYDSNYLMIESSVYFEPYYHVLRALQQLREDDFPMKRYIIDVNKYPERPPYASSTIRTQSSLNEAQLKAYNSAMSESFAVIQGPPGTGKTYLGLVIVKSLLSDHLKWYNGRYPLLVVCFTNHALDQFLEGLLSATDRIIRIGGQSKNEKLNEYNIRNFRKRRDKCNMEAYNAAYRNVQMVHGTLKALQSLLDAINRFGGVIDILNVFRAIPECQGTPFRNMTVEEFTEWILSGLIISDRRLNQGSAQNTFRFEENEHLDDLIALEDQMEIETEIDDVFDEGLAHHLPSGYLVSINGLKEQIGALRARKAQINDIDKNAVEILQIDNEINSLENKSEYVEVRMEEGQKTTTFVRPELLNFQEPNNMHPDNRWKLYFYCLDVYKKQLLERIDLTEKEYKKYYEEYEELRQIVDIDIMRSNLVVGMTTTAAARLRGSINALKSRIVVVEEAAEIMEAHVVTALTEHCQHLILIGDHQQLRPNTADYTMEKKYSLGVSLFERMVRNEIHCNTLSVQHRMRPEIAKLVAPAIYPHLENHPSVNNFPPVNGIDYNLYFITHEYPEEEANDQSKVNHHEVKFLLCLAKYLILNGYEAEDITIIAAYSGQMFAMRKARQKYSLLKDVRITVLDNYQGEENKIILLSLVRNNKNGKIGFLSLENRVCVALSRAREGLYVMGNIGMLMAHSEVWKKMRDVLEKQNSLGNSLPLRCQVHRDKTTFVSSENDFYKVAEGGCDLTCNQLLTCGHFCRSQCHVLNRDHSDYRCKEKCTKTLCDNGHLCPKLCFQNCGDCEVPMARELPCGHTMIFPCFQTEFVCTHPVTIKLPCTHTVTNKPCYVPVEKFKCPHPCGARIDECGHVCTLLCHIRNDPDHLEYKCAKPCVQFRSGCSLKVETHICPRLCYQECADCDIVVKKKRSCSHFENVACSFDVELLECKKPCKKLLSCEHKCKLECHEICGQCAVKVPKKIERCGHDIIFECSKTPSTRDCRQNCPLLLPCGHKCAKRCKDDCTQQCIKLVDSVVPLACTHSAKIPCHLNSPVLIYQNMEQLLRYCKHPCGITLECKHNCLGSCGECYQGRIHKICSEDCGVDLVCGHKCSVPCRQICPPCSEPCIYKCPHSVCKKRCGSKCTPCAEPCLRRCAHVKCTKLCSEKCDTPPCTKHCTNELKCGHTCIGFCGEPCPPLCMICDREELLDFCLGYEEEEDARFVLLEECQHVIESQGMDMWLNMGDDAVNIKRCPKCRMPLTITKRYSDFIKGSIEEIQSVKVKFFGEVQENNQMKAELQQRLQRNREESLSVVSPVYREVHLKLTNKLKNTLGNRRQPFDRIMGQMLTSKIQILEQIGNTYQSSSHPKSVKVINYINFLLERLILQGDYRMTAQEVNDYTLELKRLRRIIQLGDLEQRYPLVLAKDLYKDLLKQLFSVKKYDVDDDQVKRNLENLAKQVGNGLIVSSDEMQAIVKAIGVKHGAWYKCPNGHPYAIGDCGGAMVESTCPDCGARIGGRNHALTSGNSHFSVDGSRYGAWSEQANMANYIL